MSSHRLSSVLLLGLLSAGCGKDSSTSDSTQTEDSADDTGEAPTTGTFTASLEFPGAVAAGTTLYIAANDDSNLWLAAEHTQDVSDPVFPYALELVVEPGEYWVGAFLDVDGDGKPGEQEPRGAYIGDGGPVSASVSAGESKDLGAISLRKPPGGSDEG